MVILNALRAFNKRAACNPRRSLLAAFGKHCREEHRQPCQDVKRIRYIADRLDEIPAQSASTEVMQIHTFLTDKVLPHNEAEDATTLLWRGW